MRATLSCPKCSGHKFAVTDEFRQPDQGVSDLTKPLPAVTVVAHRPDEDRTGPWARKTAGKLETWICLECGFTELYAKGLDEIESLAKQHPDRVRVLDAGPGNKGPYR
jgi:predicted nucleic-acid-binding Zn-ribbon protein